MEVQRRVANLLKDKILVGHAVSNDLKAGPPIINPLFWYPYDIHPAGIAVVASISLDARYPAVCVQIQTIQGAASGAEEPHVSGIRNTNPSRGTFKRSFDPRHATCWCMTAYVCPQVTDARATMAIYRLHRREWEKGKTLQLPSLQDSDVSDPSRKPRKRKRSVQEGSNDPPGGGKKGISTGLSTIVKRFDPSKTKNTSSMGSKKKAEWWLELGSSKSSIRTS